MTQVKDGNVVEINYTLTNEKGEVLDNSEGKAPLAYIHGKQNIIPGLEKEITGKKVGDTFKVTISPEEAYGTRNENLIQTFPKNQFGEDASQVQVGMQFQMQGENGQVFIFTAVEVREDEVVLDGNHPLAGEPLTFDVEVMSLREASEEELAKGHLLEEGEDCSDEGSC